MPCPAILIDTTATLWKRTHYTVLGLPHLMNGADTLPHQRPPKLSTALGATATPWAISKPDQSHKSKSTRLRPKCGHESSSAALRPATSSQRRPTLLRTATAVFVVFDSITATPKIHDSLTVHFLCNIHYRACALHTTAMAPPDLASQNGHCRHKLPCAANVPRPPYSITQVSLTITIQGLLSCYVPG